MTATCVVLDADSAAKCPDSCNDQGDCVNGACRCFPGYAGQTCAESKYALIHVHCCILQTGFLV